MSDLRPTGELIELGGKEYNLLFTLNVIDALQEKCNEPVFDTLDKIIGILSGNIDSEHLKTMRATLTVLINNTLPNDKHISEKEVGDAITFPDIAPLATGIVRAFGISIPDPDDEDEEDDDDRPKAETGQ